MESTTWRCPQCQLPLHRTETGPLVEWRCPPCSLSWVTRTNLISIVQKSGLDQLTEQLLARAVVPRLPYADVSDDSGPGCGAGPVYYVPRVDPRPGRGPADRQRLLLEEV